MFAILKQCPSQFYINCLLLLLNYYFVSVLGRGVSRGFFMLTI